ncbi:hypothetical protein [Sphingobacterium sp. JB170]|uniref:hypothetical protein n=1 Tax=Sphingobacterium sp. JB170 TaxID=1434842 RepID=UPI000B363FBC|nr:hypothetical protein [Sphingobacterium sp. JB170]
MVIDDPGTTNGDRIKTMSRLSQNNGHPKRLELSLDIYPGSEKDGRYDALVQSRLSYLHVQKDSLKFAFQAIGSAEWYASRTTDKIARTYAS